MSEETKTKERTDQVTLWDKVKTLFTSVRERVVAFFTTTARKIKNIWGGAPWARYALVAILIAALAGGIGYWRDRQLTNQINTLETQVQAKAEQIKAVEAEKNDLKAQIEELKKQLTATQAKNDSNIKEAGKNAYQKANSIPDTDVLRNFNLLINGARKRNANR